MPMQATKCGATTSVRGETPDFPLHGPPTGVRAAGEVLFWQTKVYFLASNPFILSFNSLKEKETSSWRYPVRY